MDVASGTVSLRTPRGRLLLAAAALGSGAIGIDAFVVPIALLAIGRDLGVPIAAPQWSVLACTLALAALILLGGALGDLLGRRRSPRRRRATFRPAPGRVHQGRLSLSSPAQRWRLAQLGLHPSASRRRGRSRA